ncbi:urease accessory protein UreD [Francisella philomiragia]|uniref:UreD urease accessory family protein n=1 Tax=Francisella philomiragia TaxID=28110 RepID=A0A0B6D3A4_9GAMM|nr:urease accessory protein UreD [Francisella philomiragia]AJI53346.1 ureD urease accessory family protein [Francisella philomiragia]
MSISLSFRDNSLSLDKLKLPTRYYHFNEEQNYIKLLSIGEGIFPADRISTKINLSNSDIIITTESATKVYPSTNKFGISNIKINLANSNIEFINDELILYKESKFLQFLKLTIDESSTFFYGDILSHGRSFESFDFNTIAIKNHFYINEEIEYLEKYIRSGNQLKAYIKRHNSKNSIFAKIYLRLKNNETFLEHLNSLNLDSFTLTMNKKMILGVLNDKNMDSLKTKVLKVWELYRKELDKGKFNLGKQ